MTVDQRQLVDALRPWAVAPGLGPCQLRPLQRSNAANMKLVRQLWYILTLRERVEGAVLLCGLTVGALLEAVAVGLVVPFIAVLNERELMLNAPVGRRILSS